MNPNIPILLAHIKAIEKIPLAAAAKSLQSCLTLWDPIDGSPPGFPVRGILQARTLEWVAISFSNAWKWKVNVLVAQSCPTLCDPMDCSPSGSSVHGIFQARVLEWGACAIKPTWKWKSERVSRSVVSDSLWPHGLGPTRLLCPWNSPCKNTGVDNHSLLQGIRPLSILVTNHQFRAVS